MIGAKRHSNSGFTLVELLVASTSLVAVTFLCVSLFTFAATRVADANSQAELNTELLAAADQIEAAIREAHSCSVVTTNSGTALVCTMPNAGTDTNQDGIWDVFTPSTLNSDGQASYTAGSNYWYYTTPSSTGNPAVTSGGNPALWRAISSSATSMSTNDVDPVFSRYFGQGLRFPLIRSLAAQVDSTTQMVTFTLTATASTTKEAQDTSSESNRYRTVTLSRSVVWRNWE